MGAFPKGGKATCIVGPESSSKSTLMYYAIAADQRKGFDCALLDVESSLDKDYVRTLGVDLSKLYIVDRIALLKSLNVKDRTAVAAEEWLDLTAKLIASNQFGVVGLDSVPAMQPMIEVINGVSNAKIGSVAVPMAKAYRALSNALAVSNCAFIYINQWRMQPGNMYVPRIEVGGEAWRYLQSMKLEVSKSLDKEGTDVSGIIVKGKVSKSKVCIPYKTFEFTVEFGKGIIEEYEIIDEAVLRGIIVKTGNSYTYKEHKLGVGEGQLQAEMFDFPEIYQQIKKDLLAADLLSDIPMEILIGEDELAY